MKTYLTEQTEQLLVTNEWGTYAYYSKPQCTRAYIAESKGPNGFNYVRHGKWIKPFEGILCDTAGARGDWGQLLPPQQHHTNRWHLFDAVTYADDALVASAKSAFDSKVVTSDTGPNEFELLPFLYELDDTMAMFSLKYLRDIILGGTGSRRGLTYGQVTWGIIPFISDAKALCQSVKDILRRAGSYTRSVNKTRSFVVPGPTVPISGQLTFDREVSLITRRLNGTITTRVPHMEPLDRALYLLDEAGVHPDLKTVWDVIPLSFVVDYFVPIGDILESFHPRGWARHLVTFDGHISSKEKHIYAANFVSSNGNFGGNTAIFSYYERQPVQNYSPQLVSAVEWKAPSPKEIFNTAYLTTALKRFF